MPRPNGVRFDAQPLQGTRDFYPEDYIIQREWLFNTWRNISKQHSYLEYDAPIVEKLSLWEIKVDSAPSEKSLQSMPDIWSTPDILKEMYTFELGGTKMCLRPEMTPSLARMVLGRLKIMSLPIRWFSLPQCWRSESTTRGRKKEFYQWNIDILGVTGIGAELELISMVIEFFHKVGLSSDTVVIKISDRRVLEAVLKKLGIDQSLYPAVLNLVNKFQKIEKEELSKLFTTNLGLSSEQLVQLYGILGTKDLSVLSRFLGDDATEVLQNLLDILMGANVLGFQNYLELDLTIVRDFTYYNGTVFEAYFRTVGPKRAILGGGRYDKFLETYTGVNPSRESPLRGWQSQTESQSSQNASQTESLTLSVCKQTDSEDSDGTPAVGFAMGDMVITEGLNELGLLPKLTMIPDFLVVASNEIMEMASIYVANTLRNRVPNLKIETYLGKYRLKNALDYANKINVRYVIILFPEKWAKGLICVKDMTIAENVCKIQRTWLLEEFINHQIYE